MKCLLDTVVLLWILFDERKSLSKKAVNLLERGDVECHLSAVSTWEIAIKFSTGKLHLKEDPKTWLPGMITRLGFRPLPVSVQHSLEVASLDRHHQDPFDRLLIAQAKIEKMTILSPDRLLKKYDVSVIW